jgi:hypothetical protein
MGKYTDLARVLGDTPQEVGGVDNNKSVNINNISKAISSNSVALPAEKVTNLRTTNLTNLSGEEVWIASAPKPRYTNLIGKSGPLAGAAVPCIHGMTRDACAVCSGYARWLIEDEGRLRRAQASPEKVRREFWRSVRGAG